MARARTIQGAACHVARLLFGAVLLVMPEHAGAQTAAPLPAATAALPVTSPGEPDFAATLFAPARANLLGNMWGLRPQLDALGISLGAVDTAEILANASGGIHRGAAYDGAIQLSLGADLSKALGWTGAAFNISAFQLNGRNLSADNLDNVQTASCIEAQRATRLWELWLQQTLLGGKFSVRLGQQSLDQEFIVSAGSSIFINGTMGWPLVPAVDLYAGGPAYPLSSLGVRVQAQPTSALTVLAGVFNDNPPGGKQFADDSQLRGATQSGTAFNLNTGALGIAELQYSGTPFQGNGAGGLRGTYKAGGWFDTGGFPDQHYDTAGMSLADPASSHVPRMHATNWSLYAVADQTIWQPSPAAPRAISLFARIMAAPADRNLARFSVNAGLTMKQPLAGRDNDVFGAGFGVARFSSSVAQLDTDAAFFDHANTPVRSSESFLELTYQAQLAAWVTLQPDLQYVIAPGGGIANPQAPGKRIGDEAVFGLRSTVVF